MPFVTHLNREHKKEKSEIKSDQYHLFELPWPKDVLINEIGDKDVTLKVTLSYFIEPNPGNRQYASNFSYHSHELDFKLIKPLEKIEVFKSRVSKPLTENESDEKPDMTGEEWKLKERIRSKGSVKKDFINTSGVELSMRNTLAVYPKNGWYRLRKKLKKYDSTVRYSLIVSIETDNAEVDIYTPVKILVENEIRIGV